MVAQPFVSAAPGRPPHFAGASALRSKRCVVLGHLFNRVAIQSLLNFIQIKSHDARRYFPYRNYLVVNPLIDGADTDLLLMSKLAFSSVFARDGRQRMFYHMKANGQTPQARCVIVAFLSFSLGA